MFPISSPDIDGLRHRLKHAKDVTSATKEIYLRCLQDEDDLIALANNKARPRRNELDDYIWRMVLGFVLLVAALLLQIVSDWWIKALVVVQMLGITVALCLPRRD